MPGYSQATIAAYPKLGNLAAPLEVSRTWGIHENVFNVNERTILFLQDVLAEVLPLFPSQYIHIGGDEVPKKLCVTARLPRHACASWDFTTRISCKATLPAAWTLFSPRVATA
jgi:N-acetyl-beta-hexosaminidase